MDEPGRRSRALDRVTRRCETPVCHATSRSRSRVRTRSPSRTDRDREQERGYERVEILERELQRERDRLRSAETRRRSPSRRVSELRDVSRGAATAGRRAYRDSPRRKDDEHRVQREPEPRVNAGQSKRSCSPSLSKKDIVDILKTYEGWPYVSVTQSTHSQKICSHTD